MVWVWGIGIAVTLPLAIYAAYLLWRVRQAKQAQIEAEIHAQQQQAKMQQEFDQHLVQSIRVIANATLQEQCELSEAALRIGKLLEQIQSASEATDYTGRFPALHELKQAISHHPVREARKALSKQQRFKLDLERFAHEERLGDAIRQELPLLKEFSI